MRMGEMEKDIVSEKILNPSKGVSKEFLDTPFRKKMRIGLRSSGLAFFCITTLCILSVAIASLMGDPFDLGGFLIIPVVLLMLLNIFGMCAELAGDSGGVNWFARGFILLITSMGVFFVLSAVLGLIVR